MAKSDPWKSQSPREARVKLWFAVRWIGLGTGVRDGNYRPDTSFDGHSRAATVNLSLLHFYNSEPETQFCQREGAGAGNRGGPERAIQADSPRSVSLKAQQQSELWGAYRVRGSPGSGWRAR